MRAKFFALAAAAGLTLGAAGAATPAPAATPSLIPGVYNVFLVVTKTTQVQGSTCPYVPDNGYQWYVTYPGPGKTGAVAHLQVVSPGAKYILIVTLPKTPASGAGAWTGKYSAVLEPGTLAKFSGDFDFALGVADDFSWGGTGVFGHVLNSNGDICTVDFNQSGVWVGPLPGK